MISHVKSYALKYMISGNFFTRANSQVKYDFVNFNFQTSVTFFSYLGPVQVTSRSLGQARPWLPEHHLRSKFTSSMFKNASLCKTERIWTTMKGRKEVTREHHMLKGICMVFHL